MGYLIPQALTSLNKFNDIGDKPNVGSTGTTGIVIMGTTQNDDMEMGIGLSLGQ